MPLRGLCKAHSVFAIDKKNPKGVDTHRYYAATAALGAYSNSKEFEFVLCLLT